MRCPWPAVRLARVLREGAASVIVLADDPRAGVELAAIAHAAGARFNDAAPRFTVERD